MKKQLLMGVMALSTLLAAPAWSVPVRINTVDSAGMLVGTVTYDASPTTGSAFIVVAGNAAADTLRAAMNEVPVGTGVFQSRMTDRGVTVTEALGQTAMMSNGGRAIVQVRGGANRMGVEVGSLAAGGTTTGYGNMF